MDPTFVLERAVETVTALSVRAGDSVRFTPQESHAYEAALALIAYRCQQATGTGCTAVAAGQPYPNPDV